jgi:hypothetical protein
MAKQTVEVAMLADWFNEFEEARRREFDELAWQDFNAKLIQYSVDLYSIVKRECVLCSSDGMALYTSGDVERGAILLDLKRHRASRKKTYKLQLTSLVSSLLSGVALNWAFFEMAGRTPSVWPWLMLVFFSMATVGTAFLVYAKGVE